MILSFHRGQINQKQQIQIYFYLQAPVSEGQNSQKILISFRKIWNNKCSP